MTAEQKYVFRQVCLPDHPLLAQYVMESTETLVFFCYPSYLKKSYKIWLNRLLTLEGSTRAPSFTSVLGYAKNFSPCLRMAWTTD